MSNKTFVKPSLEAVIEFWGTADWNPPKGTDNSKLRLVEVHPSKSLVLAADKDGKVLLWDYAQKTTIFGVSCAELLLNFGKRSTDQTTAAIFGIRNRISQRSAQRMTGSIRSPDIVYTKVGTVPVGTAPAVVAKLKQQIGTVLQVSFTDTAYRLSCMDPSIRGTSFIPSACAGSGIAVVCENMLIFYDYATGVVSAVTPAELNDSAPTSVEFASFSYCLIGCSDGAIRVWDFSAPAVGTTSGARGAAQSGFVANVPPPPGAVAFTLNTYSKAGINVVKSIPIKHPATATEEDPHKIRVVTVGAYGQCLVWDVPVVTPRQPSPGSATGAGSDSSVHSGTGAGNILPLARIKETLGTGIVREEVVFDAENNALLVVLNERKIRMWDFEDLSAISAISGVHMREGSVHGGGGGGGSGMFSSSHGGISSSVHGGGGGGGGGGGFLGSSLHGGFLGASSHGKGMRSLGLKRGGISALIGGGSDAFASVFSLKSVGALAPERAVAAAYGKITSFGPVQHPYFTSGCYVLCSKANTFAILQDKGSGVSDEMASNEDGGTGPSGGADKTTTALSLIHEFSLRALMDRYFAEHAAAVDPTLLPAFNEALRADALDPTARVYAVKPHPTQPHLCTVVTSVGVLVVSLILRLPGPMVASHPKWGSIKLVHANDCALQKILCALPVSESVPGQGVEVSPEVLEDCGALEIGPGGGAAQSAASAGPGLKRRISSKRSMGSSRSVGDPLKASSRPVLHASPSGAYCAVHWPESMVYVVLCMNITAGETGTTGETAPQSGATIELDRGHCLEFAWVGTDDMYLIKTPPEVTSMGVVAAKQRRQSVSAMLFGAQKESSFMIPSLLVLKQVVGGKGPKDSVRVVDLTLQLAAGKPATANTPAVLPSLVTALFGGPVLNMNTLNAKESEAVMTAAAQARRADAAAAAAAAAASGPGGDHKRAGPSGVAGPVVPSSAEGEEEAARVIEDSEVTIRELRATHSPPTHKQISTFFTVVTARWLKQRQAQESAAAATALAAKDKAAKKGRKSGAATADAAAAGEEETASASAADSALQLVAVSGPLQPAQMVRWDFERNVCALVQTGSPGTVTVLRLVSAALTAEDRGVAQLSMQPLCAVQLCYPSSLNRSLTSLAWHNGALLTTASDHSAVRVTFFSAEEPRSKAGQTGPESSVVVADTFELPISSPYSSALSRAGASLGGSFDCTPIAPALPAVAVLGLHHGAVFTSTRDGTVFAQPTSFSPALTYALKTAEPAGAGELPAPLTSDEKEAVLTLQLHRGKQLPLSVAAEAHDPGACAREVQRRALFVE